MPSMLVRRRQLARLQARRRRAPRAGKAFTEQTSIPGHVPMDAWAGWDGAGWGPATSLFLTTSHREGGVAARVLRLDAVGGTWVDDGAPSGAETINKLRSGPARNTGVDRLWAFYETPPPGQRFLISREAGSGWTFEGVPHTEANYPDPVGGRGLGLPLGGVGGRVLAGASYLWKDTGAQFGRVFEMNPTGTWVQIREFRKGLMWEIEFDELGRPWEFWNDNQGRLDSHVFVNGVDRGASPGGDISSAAWFKGHMYVIGAVSRGSDTRNRISRSTDGQSWGQVHQFGLARKGDHVFHVPRGEGELWAVGHDPFEVAYTLDGTTWTRETSVPTIATGSDNNHMTAIGYWKDSVWLCTRDVGAASCRVFTDFTGEPPEPEEPLPEDPFAGGTFPPLTPPPRPPELPTIPVPPTKPSVTASDVFPKGDQPPMQKWVEQADRFVDETSTRLDAFLVKWLDEFIRVMQDAWVRLNALFKATVERIARLEQRIADTYSWGSGGVTVDKIIALPLRVVRNEELVEMTIAAETPSESGSISIDLMLDDSTLLSGSLGSGQNFVVIEAPEETKLSKDQKLAAMTRSAGEGAKGIVVQARCR